MISETSSIIGNFEGLHGTYISGWAFQSDAPDARVRLLLQIDDLTPVEVIADLFRIDLEAAGIGDGCHAFQLPVPSILADGAMHTVFLRDAASGALILDSPHRIQVADLAALSTKKGSLDSFTGRVVRGWACDLERPDESVTLELLLNDEVVVEFKTDRYRPDLEEMGMGSGHHGFEVKVPNTQALNVPTRLHIRFQEGHAGLQGSPIGYFNPGDVLSFISRLEKRLDEQEDHLIYLDYLVRQAGIRTK